MLREQLLDGVWSYRIGKGRWGTVRVPFSARPVGHSECVLCFEPAERAPRTFLRFDGINYAAEVTLNGQKIGEMLPYCTYIFNITDLLLPGENRLCVSLEDIRPVFGPSEGWENYGGIPRSVRLLFREEAYITDVFFDTTLTDDYQNAEMRVRAEGNTAPGDLVRVRLSDGGTTVCEYTERPGEELSVRVENVHLWSPDDPHLYMLETELIRAGSTVDRDVREVGFREFRAGARRFLLNGKPTFLTGVCYHEFFGEQGHLVTEEQTEQDFRTIKSLGCNYVRLVHYPHNARTLALADRLGLMVSEEPGLWWSDTALPENHDGAIEVLRRTIRRDRTHPSIVFWLCFNECEFTEQFLIDAARACREADPTRLVSGANCMSLADTPKYFRLCGFDFYTMHPYAATPQRAVESVGALRDLPLLFTEWGGYYVTDNRQLFEDFVDTMTAFWREPDDGNVLAGASYWCFADMYEFNRRRPAVRDGILREGLVDPWRKPNAVFEAFRAAFARLEARPRPEDSFAAEPIGEEPLTSLPLPPADPDAFDGLMAAARAPIPRYRHSTKRERKLEVGPRLPVPVGELAAVPLTVSDGRSVTVPITGQGSTLDLLCAGGPFAWPLGGEWGDTVTRLSVTMEDGSARDFPLRNGIEIATVFGTWGPSRISPVADAATPVLRFSYDRNHENYLVQRVSLPLGEGAKIVSLTFTDAGTGGHFLLYGVRVR